MDKKLASGFESPSSIYRSAPFWSWNDELTVDELCRQVDMMQKGGFGGGFMHSRMGLVTGYLSDEWMECIGGTIEYAAKKGFKAYLYDEDRCSSGFAGGIVTRNPENRMRYLKVERRGGRYEGSVTFGPPTEWYNGSTYVDIASEKTVGDFIDSTYEPYAKLFGKHFGNTVPAIFTDEPNYYRGNLYRWGRKNQDITVLPWTLGFDRAFREIYGYDILEKISLMVEDKEGFETVRYHYFKLMTRMLMENFGVRVYNWCGKRNLLLTGHYMGEESIHMQINNIGEAMCMYEYMHWPGIDYLGKSMETPLLPKQCSSVAHQLGKERVLSEMFGCSGQNFSLADRKLMGDWHIALGVNFFCPHLYLYSLRGCRKRDYPPTISHHQPYWEFQKGLEDYFARMNYIMSKGKARANILVVHPVESGWCMFVSRRPEKRDDLLEGGWHTESGSRVRHLDSMLSEITRLLLENKLEFDFGSEHLMEKYAGESGGLITLGQGAYTAAVIPPAVTVREKTLRLLLSFGKSGGRIFASEEFPYLVEGERKPAGDLEELKSLCIFYSSPENLAGLLRESVERTVTVEDSGGNNVESVYVHARDIEKIGIRAIFLANTSETKSVSTVVGIQGQGALYRADAFSGRIEKAEALSAGNGKILVSLDFPPSGSHLLLLESKGSPVLKKKEPEPARKETVLEGWKMSLSCPNIMVLDRCRFRKSLSGRWSGEMLVLEVQERMEKGPDGQDVEMMFDFEVEKGYDPVGLSLIIESAEKYKVKINGKAVDPVVSGSFVDPSFKRINIPDGIVSEGRNRLLLKTVFTHPKKRGTLVFRQGGTELENVYIAGNFAVSVKKMEKRKEGYFHEGLSLSPAGRIESNKDINIQGFPFYTGRIIAEKEVELDGSGKKCFLRFDRFRCTAASVKVNGKHAGILFLPPYRLDITGFVRRGRNLVSVECAGTLRNLLGPFHQENISPNIVGPGSFLDYEIRAYSNVYFGLGGISLTEEG